MCLTDFIARFSQIGKKKFIVMQFPTVMDMSIPANRERLIDCLVGSILLYDDGKIVITFYYKDEPFVGVLEEIASASDKVGSDTNALGSPNKSRRNKVAPAFVSSFFTNRAPPFSLAKKECLRPDQ